MSRVTVLGLGAMGSRMAANLVKAGHAVTVWNRDPAKAAGLTAAGATAAATPRAAVATAEVVVAMVRDDAASRHVWLDPAAGALAGMPKTAVAVESSTLTVEWVRELAGHFAAAGVAFLDGPVAGSRPQAEAAQLVYLVGGPADTLAAVTPVLKAMGSAVHHAGPAGCGAAVKLLVNAMLGVQVAAAAELLGLMRRAGVAEATAIDLLAATAVCSPAVKAAAAGMLGRTYAPLFPVELIEKDLAYATHEAGGAGRVPVVEAARAAFAAAVAAGRGADHMTAVNELYR